MSWAAIQLGSREHYSIPRALRHAGRLESLITDSWLTRWQSSIIQPLLPSLAARRNDEIPDRVVTACTIGRLGTDLRMRWRKYDTWQTVLCRNEWFQEWCASRLKRSSASTVFSYSYTARRPFVVAGQRNIRRVLGQIDPGPREEEVVLEATRNYQLLAPPADRAPLHYWEMWREEIALADAIIVNSPWSARLLSEAGVPSKKLVEVPLVYERAESSVSSIQLAEAAESMEKGAGSNGKTLKRGKAERLKALFLGSVILRKGVGQLFDAIRMLKNEPVDFTFAGPIGVKIPDEISSAPSVRFLGPVDKAAAEKLYRESDVFLFPTLSDGFGLTQLEALGHGLPVIVSKHCGQVVEDRVNGFVLSGVTPEAISDAIMQLVRDPDLLAELTSNACVPEKCHPRHLAPALLALEKD